MAKVTLNDLSKALGLNEKEPKKDFHYYGTIVSSNPEDRTYEVSINRDQNISVEAARLVGAAVGDTVMVTVMANGYATVTGRLGGDLDATDAQRAADDAADAASGAMGTAQTAMTNASEANRIANNAKTLAENAEAEAGRAKTAADNAVTEAARSASAAEESERQAKRSADAADASETSATQSAQAAASSQASASQSAQSAADSQASAARSEQSAQESATSAANSAASASRSTIYANAALNQLGIVEDVAGTLDWIAKHGTYTRTTDTAIDSSKVYFVYDSSTGDYTPVIDPKTSELNTYYELDITESQADFIMSHLAVTSRGLWVLPNGIGSASDPKDAPKYKALLAADGMWIYDDHGVMVAKYGAGISFDSTREYRIGDQNTYIRYIDSNNDGIADRIEIKAASISLGSTDLATEMSKKVGNDEVIAKINLSTEGAKIKASKVEIDGTTTFNAIKSQADAAYDAKGAADAVQVGGRNLYIRSTSVPGYFSGGGDAISSPSNQTKERTSDYIAIDPTAPYVLQTWFDDSGSDSYQWISFHWLNSEKVSIAEPIRAHMQGILYKTWTLTPPANAAYARLSARFQELSEWRQKVKLEKGNKATDWTPAPEDVQNEIDAKKSIHTLDSSYSKTYAQLLAWSKEGYDAGGWAVSSTAGVAVGDTVRIKCSVSDMNNAAVYVLGTVTSVTSATILRMISHGLDTTVIDGGNILANSITADQIKGNTITLGQIDTNFQNSILNEKIEVGGRNLFIGSTDTHLVNASVTDTKTTTMLYFWTTPGKSYTGYKSFGPTKTYSTVGHFTETFTAANDALNYFCIKHNGSTHDFTVYFDVPEDGIKAGETLTMSFDIVGFNPSVANGLDIKNFKLERGDKATDWTPAPEDVASDIDDASKIATNYLTFDETNGLNIGYTGKTEHTNIKGDGMRIYDSTGSTEPVASFLSTGSTIGKAIDGESRTVTSNKGMRFYKRSGSDDITLAHIGYDQGVDADGNTNTYAPYYTFGKRNNRSAIGNYSTAEGFNTTASSCGSHAEGFGTTASGTYSHAEGTNTTASSNGSHAEGLSTTASGDYSHVEGFVTTASSNGSHAEGYHTTASGDYSHAEGDSTTASGPKSHAGGYYTVAGYSGQTVIGKYNSNKSNTAFEIGNGYDEDRSNALTVDWNGNVVASGGLTLNGDEPVADWVTEKGTNGSWKYRKWANGRFEAILHSSKGSTGTLTQLGSSGIYYSAVSAVTFPTAIGITEVDYVSAVCSPPSNYFMHMITNRISTSSVYIGYIRYGSGTAVSNVDYSVKVEGTWA